MTALTVTPEVAMPIDLSWSVTKEIVGWIASAAGAARTRGQRRVANVVEHAGVLVAGVSRLNAVTVALLRPLVYFDPAEWDAQRRAGLVGDLILLSDETTIVPRMRTARSALRSLLVTVDDIDIKRPAAEILAMADFLFEYVPGDPYRRDAEDHDATRTAGTLIGQASMPLYGPDSLLTIALPTLLKAIRSAEQPREVSRLQRMARDLTAVVPERFRHLRGELPLDLRAPTDTEPAAGVLAPYAESMQVAFGELIGAQQRVFPEMPSPAWAFSDR
jgi:hypothetical protein